MNANDEQMTQGNASLGRDSSVGNHSLLPSISSRGREILEVLDEVFNSIVPGGNDGEFQY